MVTMVRDAVHWVVGDGARAKGYSAGLGRTIMDGIPINIEQVGPWGLFLLLVFLVVRAVVRGDLVPRKTHEDTLHDRDMWRAAHMTSEAARQEERDQKRELLAYAKLGTHVVTSLPSVGENEGT